MYLDRIVATKHKEVEVLAQTFRMDEAIQKSNNYPQLGGLNKHYRADAIANSALLLK